jgi:hypothetical protein
MLNKFSRKQSCDYILKNGFVIQNTEDFFRTTDKHLKELKQLLRNYPKILSNARAIVLKSSQFFKDFSLLNC